MNQLGFHPSCHGPVFVFSARLHLKMGTVWSRGCTKNVALGRQQIVAEHTLPETHIAPENGWLEDEFPFGMAYFQGLC